MNAKKRKEKNMEFITLSRTGRPPVAFQGNKLCAFSTEKKEGKEKFERWYELALYETVEHTYAAHVVFCSTWTREAPGHAEVLPFSSLKLLFEALASYDPCRYCVLRPERTEEEKNANGPKNDMVRRELQQSFQHLIQEAVSALKYQDVQTSVHPEEGDHVRVEVWIPYELKELLEQRRGSFSLSEVAVEAFRKWLREKAR